MNFLRYFFITKNDFRVLAYFVKSVNIITQLKNRYNVSANNPSHLFVSHTNYFFPNYFLTLEQDFIFFLFKKCGKQTWP